MATRHDDWREIVLGRLPEPTRLHPMTSHATLDELIATAAYQRRMSEGDYIMRAARAFACFDLGADLQEAAESEPPIANVLTPRNPRRLRGRGFGQWRIIELGNVKP